MDEFGNNYNLFRHGSRMRPAFATETAALGPDEGVADMLLFEPPVKVAKSLILELPQGAYGARGKPARFHISVADFARK